MGKRAESLPRRGDCVGKGTELTSPKLAQLCTENWRARCEGALRQNVGGILSHVTFRRRLERARQKVREDC